jgi:hypothetical protein
VLPEPRWGVFIAHVYRGAHDADGRPHAVCGAKLRGDPATVASFDRIPTQHRCSGCVAEGWPTDTEVAVAAIEIDHPGSGR